MEENEKKKYDNGRKFIPGVYKHFNDEKHRYYAIGLVQNGESEGEDYSDDDENIVNDDLFQMIRAKHTETMKYVLVAVMQDGRMFSDVEEDLILYKALYDDGAYYVRPDKMFMSVVDKEKYPEATQTFRLENQDFHYGGISRY